MPSGGGELSTGGEFGVVDCSAYVIPLILGEPLVPPVSCCPGVGGGRWGAWGRELSGLRGVARVVGGAPRLEDLLVVWGGGGGFSLLPRRVIVAARTARVKAMLSAVPLWWVALTRAVRAAVWRLSGKGGEWSGFQGPCGPAAHSGRGRPDAFPSAWLSRGARRHYVTGPVTKDPLQDKLGAGRVPAVAGPGLHPDDLAPSAMFGAQIGATDKIVSLQSPSTETLRRHFCKRWRRP